MDGGVAAQIPRPLQHPLNDAQWRPEFLSPGRRQSGDEIPEAARPGNGHASGAQTGQKGTDGAGSGCVRRAAERHGRPRDIDHDGVSCACSASWSRTRYRKQVVPIVPMKSRTFGMEGMFRQLGSSRRWVKLYTPAGCRPADVLQGRQDRADSAGSINEAGRHGHWIAAATSYANTAWRCCRSTSTTRCSASSASATWHGRRATCARAAFCSAHGRAHDANGEGLQHQDGHSHLQAAMIPNCVSYDPTFAYELAVIIRTACPHVCESGRRVLLPHGDERD